MTEGIATPGGGPGSGQTTIDTNGIVTIQFTGGTPNAAYNTQFCPFPYVPPPNECFSIATMTADANGAATLSMKFPRAGTWGSGTFFLQGSTNSFNTGEASLHGSASFNVVPENGASGNPPSQLPQDPLTSGTISIANQTVTITLNGAVPNASYDVTECGGPTQCHLQGKLLTDSSGNGTITFPALTRPATEFEIVRRDSGGMQLGAGFLSGFKVP